MGTTWRATAWSNLVLGEWIEDAYQILESWTVALENKSGKRLLYVGPIMCSTKKSAIEFSDRINRHIEKNESYSPNLKHWTETYPVYGSDEYVMTDEESEWKHQEIEMDKWPTPRYCH